MDRQWVMSNDIKFFRAFRSGDEKIINTEGQKTPLKEI
jgi:hypothetical protein